MGHGTVEIKTRSTRWLDRNFSCQAGFEFFDYTRWASDVAGNSGLHFPFLHEGWSYDPPQSKLNNINGLKFYYSIRGNLDKTMWSLQPSLAQDVEFLRELCRVLVGLYRGVAFQ